MKKRILSLALTFVLLLSMVVPNTLAVSYDSGSTSSTFSAGDVNFNPIQKSVRMLPTTRLFAAPYSDTCIDYSSIPDAPKTYKIINSQWYNGELWYGLDSSAYSGLALDSTILMCVYVRAKDVDLLDAKVDLSINGEPIEDTVIVEGTGRFDFVTVRANVSGCKAQWQIKIPGTNTWANIIPGSHSYLIVNYGLLRNLMDENNQVQIRCRATDTTSGVVYYSDAITFQYQDGEVDPATLSSYAMPVVTDPGSVEIHYLITPEDTGDQPAADEPVSDEDAAAPSENTGDSAEPDAEPTPEPTPGEDEDNENVTEPSVEPTEDPTGDVTVPEVPEETGSNEALNLCALNAPVVFLSDSTSTDGENSTEAAPVDDTTPDVKKTYNIVVNYVFENGKIVAEPYTANLAEGTSFSATVTFPTVVGYLPYVNDVQQNGIALNYSSVSEDVTINVVYKPTNVNYTVIHYKQNVSDDNYTIESTETKQGLTGSQVPEVAKEFTGFYSLLYERPEIAADGSTVIEVYYDRYYYLMNFDMDGGYGTDPVYARYGAEIGTVQSPTKAGYKFGGWAETKGGTTAATLPTTMPAGNKNYYAIWTVSDTAKVTVVFWGENADDEGYSYLADSTKDIYLKPGKEFTYSEDKMLVCDKEVHTHSDDCLNCGKTEHTHTAVGGKCYTLTCTTETHKHDTTCYAGVGNHAATGDAGKPNNPQEGQVYEGRFNKYIYIKGTWYYYSGSTASNSVAPTTCGKTETTHTHTDSCYTLTCTTEEHSHGADCYSCGKEEHTHGSGCYMQGAGLDSTLWKFVKSDTITVAADGSSVVNVYYDRTEKTLTFKYSYNNRHGYQKTETITAKWGQNIATQYNAIVKNAGSTFWSANSNYNSPYTNYFGVMPQQSKTYYYQSDDGKNGTMYYYGEDLNGNYVEMFSVSNVGGYTVTEEDHYEFKGFTYDHGTSNGSSCSNAKFYYTRNSYTLTFNDQYSNVKEESVKYEASLSTYKDYVPEVPSAYEAGSVKFGGWYQNPQCTGEEYKLDEHTMPATDLILYAKWEPVTHTVKFYLTEKSTEVYNPTEADMPADFVVDHGGYIIKEYVKNHLNAKSMNDDKPNGDYTFVTWYYYENGEKKPFDPTTQIRKDLTLYGQWSSNTLKEYTVQYVLKSDHSVKVADDLTGSGLAGTTKTFDAKGGTDLKAPYQEGYFPTVQSQSLLLDIESNSLVVTFEYVPMPAVPYTVKYVDKDTGKSLATDKVVSDNRKAVVTETFQPISGYMPDAYQKRLVVTADGENILYFYYTQDTTHAYYKITHYTQNTDGETWTEYASSQAVGDIGKRYNASPMTIPGFTYKEIKYVVNGTEVTDVTDKGAELTADGLEINLYYVRNEYPYQVRYLEQGSGKVLHDPKNGNGKYGQIVSESAIDIDGYDKVNPTSVTLNIHIDEGEGAPHINIITFYYKEPEVTINYVAVGHEGATGFGSVSPASEIVKVKTDTANGSVAEAGEGFKFVGWFKDADCTQPVDENWVTGDKIVPQKTDDKNVAATYYAKFAYNLADLTITKSGVEDIDANQTFIFDVTGPDDYKTTVVIKGNGSITIKGLKAGLYTVTERTDWSWRYKPDEKTKNVDLTGVSANGVEFKNNRENDKWLDGCAYALNKFTDSGIETKN